LYRPGLRNSSLVSCDGDDVNTEIIERKTKKLSKIAWNLGEEINLGEAQDVLQIL
jgi:hypothetical protein